MKVLYRYLPVSVVIFMVVLISIQMNISSRQTCIKARKIPTLRDQEPTLLFEEPTLPIQETTTTASPCLTIPTKCEKRTLRPKLQYLLSPTLLNSDCWVNPCKDRTHKASWAMVLFVKSAVKHSFHRELLRRTWASFSYLDGFKLATIFVTGIASTQDQVIIDEEHKRYGDILQLNTSDAYINIAQKTLGGMQWASEHLSDDYFYSSCDDDFMVDISGLVDLLNETIQEYEKERLPEFPIICTYKTKVDDAPERREKSKWFVPEHEYKWSYWPDYCLGGAYSMSVRVMRQLWEVSQKENLIRMDDVYITGVLREKIGFPRQFIKRLNNSLAVHYSGFRNILDGSRKDFMKDEWSPMNEKAKNKSSCIC